MKIALVFAAAMAAGVGIAHSVLGEKYILIRLFRRSDLPHLFGSDLFTRRTLRFAWHLTSIAWWGFAALLAGGAASALTPRLVLLTIAATFLASSIVTAAGSRGHHIAWIVFAAIGAVALVAAG